LHGCKDREKAPSISPKGEEISKIKAKNNLYRELPPFEFPLHRRGVGVRPGF